MIFIGPPTRYISKICSNIYFPIKAEDKCTLENNKAICTTEYNLSSKEHD